MGETPVIFAVTYTKDVIKKRRKKWLDGRLEVDPTSRSARLFDGAVEGVEGGANSSNPIAKVDALPEDVSLELGGGDAFVMRGGGDTGKAYLVQVDEVCSTTCEKASLMPRQCTGGFEGCVGVTSGTESNLSVRGGVKQAYVRPSFEAQLRGGASGNVGKVGSRPLPVATRQPEIFQVRRRKRSTQEILDMLGIEVRGFVENEKGGDGNVPRPGENVDVNVVKTVEEEPNVASSLDMMPAERHASSWASKPAEKVLKLAACKKKKACGGDLASDTMPGDRTTSMSRSMVHSNALPGAVQRAQFDGSRLVCPTPHASIKPARTVRIPTSFETTWEYLNTMKKAVIEEAYLRVIDSTTSVFFGDAAQSSNNHNSNNGAQKKKLRFDHGLCQLKVWKKKNAADAGDKPESVYLHLGAHRVKASEYHKSDVWLLSNEPDFGGGPIQKATAWTCVVRSLWHGPNKDGKFEVDFLSERPRYLGKSCNVYALKGPDVSIELDLADAVIERVLREGQAPIISSLLSRVLGRDPFLPSVDEVARDIPAYNEVVEKFQLNEHQCNALINVAAWHVSPEMRPVCLVHGPFGSGKSQLMVAILHLILKLRQTEGGLANARVMVSSHTNVAVDRVCLGLLESGLTDFLRVGALRKINIDLLGHSLHASESKAHASALSELKEMAQGARGRLLTKLKLQISDVEMGAERQRKKLLKTCPIVGVTCVSTSLDILQDQVFDVLILDEASQLTEPLSLAPIIRSKCKFLIAAGDPNQLPPVVCSPEHIEGDRIHSLARPLFVRLVGLGHEPHLLKTQYRCHPDISEICNRFFYDNRLEDGVVPEQRRPLVPSMPHAVAVIDVQGQEQYLFRSVYNDAEARAVGQLVRNLVQAGISPGDIGVIAFYRAHVDALKRCVGITNSGDAGSRVGEVEDCEVQIATVDSFQGGEKHVIILSTATTKASSFASDACRLNVALSRAKTHLFLVTNQGLCRSIPCLDFVLRRSQSQGGYFLGGARL